LPWETREEVIERGHRSLSEFQNDTLKTVTLNEKEGSKAAVGKTNGRNTTEVQSFSLTKLKAGDYKQLKNCLF
jgi:hypothetical protein